MFFDAHTHIPIIFEKRISQMICNASQPEEWQSLLSTQKQGLSIAIGLHPWYVESTSKNWDKLLEKHLQSMPALLIGEIGLDKLKPNMDLQEKILRQQLNLAYQYKRPVVLHCVGAWERMLHIFKTQRQKMPPRILSHAHLSSVNILKELSKKYPVYFSYSPLLLSSKKMQACIQATPLQKILIESDNNLKGPFFSSFELLIQKISLLTGQSADFLEKQIFQNTQEFIQC